MSWLRSSTFDSATFRAACQRFNGSWIPLRRLAVVGLMLEPWKGVALNSDTRKLAGRSLG
ncbi:MAG TPA: hypothetical protein VFS12_18270 [Terriglobia bacterium]|nr:hypothetical protein [Terriglobia bacterium]